MWSACCHLHNIVWSVRQLRRIAFGDINIRLRLFRLRMTFRTIVHHPHACALDVVVTCYKRVITK
jgi:hypothetical protein